MKGWQGPIPESLQNSTGPTFLFAKQPIDNYSVDTIFQPLKPKSQECREINIHLPCD